MKRILVLAIILLAAIIPFFFLKTDPNKNNNILILNGHKLSIEIADNDADRIHGLSGRLNLPNDHGLLFVFEKPDYYPFWMKDMKFPLDFVWINGDTIVDLTENVPTPSSNNSELPSFTSKNAADKVLEINSGSIKRMELKIGDKIY